MFRSTSPEEAYCGCPERNWKKWKDQGIGGICREKEQCEMGRVVQKKLEAK